MAKATDSKQTQKTNSKAETAKKQLTIAGAIYEAGSSARTKTGAWRTFKPIVSEKCTGCGICARFCPEGCIEIKNKKAIIDYDYCKGCGICANECPVKAILMARNEK